MEPTRLWKLWEFSPANSCDRDCQDKDIHFDPELTCQQLLYYCRTLKGQHPHPPLIERSFQAIPHDSRSINGDYIRILQWNVLAQSLGENFDKFDCCPKKALQWKHRRCYILEEILKHNPDVICLQEVDHFDFLNKALATQSYNGIFAPKPHSPCFYLENNNGPDGCAIFYKNNKFNLLEKKDIILKLNTANSNQVCLLVILENKFTEKVICVSTAHLNTHSGNMFMKIRNEQGRALLRFVSFYNAGHPTVVCGEFNAEPTEPFYKTMSSCPDLLLDSAYRLFGSEPPYTSWKIQRSEGEIMHTVDYIFYTKSKLTPINLLKMPIESDIGKNRVPSMSYPSDHFSLICDFFFKK